jgi:hypothetical protein
METKTHKTSKMMWRDPNSFPYYLRADIAGRKGQNCRILKAGTKTAHVVFEDGFERIVNRVVLRQRKGFKC